ncbi:MAG: hypothetical protein Q7T54_02465 [Candidatus Levybacteria bacterium]|nr:hypothetical protein [Candidatus Levybacteria bacterium]
MYYWRKINIILFIALILLLLPSVVLLLLPGFLTTDDATWMVIRFTAFFDSLRDGQIPVRVLERLNNGYGYPVANFLYPGFLYVASIIHIIGFGFVDSIKIVLILSMFLSGIFSYVWLKKIFDPYAAFIGSLFYVYTPYHLYDLYTRGSVGEVMAFACLPFILWQIERKSLHFIAFGVFILILSHNSLALLFFPLIFLYAIFTKNFLVTLCGGLLGTAMSAFFIIPAIFELSYTKFSNVNISNPLEYFASIQLVGYSSLTVLAVFLISLTMMRRSVKFIPRKGVLSLFFVIFLVSIFLSTEISSWLWKIIPSQFIQFPFRALSLIVVSVAFISAFILSKLKGMVRLGVALILLVVLAYSAMHFINDKSRTNYPDEYYSTNMDTTTVRDEYMPVWVVTKPEKAPSKKIEVVKGNAEVEIITFNSRKVELDLKNSINSTVRINQIYYPGWNAYMNYEKIEIEHDNEFGVMDVNVQRGAGRLTLNFEETPIRFLSDVVTVLAIIGGMLLMMRPLLKFK